MGRSDFDDPNWDWLLEDGAANGAEIVLDPLEIGGCGFPMGTKPD